MKSKKILHSNHYWQKFIKSFYYALSVFLIIFISTCGGYDPPSETGSIAFSLEWQDISTSRHSAQRNLETPVDCASSGVDKIEAGIFAGETNLASGSWDCTAHSGALKNVPIGENRKLVVVGKAVGGAVKYWGEKEGINVTAGPEINVGTIKLYACPTATITNPLDQDTYTKNEPIVFDGAGGDIEDGNLAGDSLVWTSNIDGQIGTGASFIINDLSLGTHTITLTATDSDDAIGTNSIVIYVFPNQIAPPAGVSVSPLSGSSVKVTWEADMSGNIAGYNVYYGAQNNLINQKANTLPITTQVVGICEHEVTALSKGITYYFGVKAIDLGNEESQLSEYKSIAILPRAPLPPNPSDIQEGQYPFNIPEAICLSKDGLRAYVTNPVNNVISLIDLTTTAVVGNILVGIHPIDLAANPIRNEVYCVNHGSNSVSVIDSTQSHPDTAVIGTLNTATAPARCLVSPDGRYLFVSCIGAGADCITVIDLDTGNEIDESPIFVGSDPKGMAIANDKLYVANEWDNNVSVIDLNPISLTKWQKFNYNIPVGDSTIDIAARGDGAFVYVANWGSATVSVIDTNTDLEVTKLNVGNNPTRMATSGNMLYVTNFSDNNVAMIDMEANAVLSHSFNVGQYPAGIAVTTDGESIYVVNKGSENVSIWEY